MPITISVVAARCTACGLPPALEEARTLMSTNAPIEMSGMPTSNMAPTNAASGSTTPRAALHDLALAIEVLVELRLRRARLTLVLGPQLTRSIRPLDRARHLEERDLANLH